MFLDDLIKENQYPIIFAGAGLTKRYFSDAPSWPDLIKNVWTETLDENSYFDRYFELKEELKDQFQILTTMAEELEASYNRLFVKRVIELPNLTVNEYYETNQSPFKTRIANVFSSLTPRKGKDKELKLLGELLSKARFIVTTNYDPLIESLLKDKVQVNVGSNGLFNPSEEYGELYKIHGSVSDPDSIVITKSDYNRASKTNILVNAKILTKLTEAPILFIGYSLTDDNIRSLLSDLSANMPFSIAEAAKRIGVIAFEPGELNLIESLNTFQYSDTTIAFTEIKTDNYQLVYSQLSKIEQGLSPYEIRKYQNAIHKLILSGNHNDGKPVLVSSINIEDMDTEISHRNIAIAIASSVDINNAFGMPDYIDYIKAYFLKDVPDFSLNLALDFIGSKTSSEILPTARIIEMANQQNVKETYRNYETLKTKIHDRNLRRPNLKSVQDVTVSHAHTTRFSSMLQQNKTPKEIYDSTQGQALSDTNNALNFIIMHIDKFNTSDVANFTEHLLSSLQREVLKESIYRKYFLAYSFIQNPNSVELQ